MKTDMGKKLARLMVTILLTSHYAPDASHMHPISSGVGILSLALKLLGSNKYRILAFLKNNAFKAWITFVHMRKRELLAKKVQKLFHSTHLFCDTISLLFSLRLFSLGIGKSIPWSSGRLQTQKPDGNFFGDPYNAPKGRTAGAQRSRLAYSLFLYWAGSALLRLVRRVDTHRSEMQRISLNRNLSHINVITPFSLSDTTICCFFHLDW